MSVNYSNKMKKNSRVIGSTLILYNDEIALSDFEKKMKKGYEYMAKLNVEYSELGSEYMLDDVDEYEAWICGV
ncbi:MAG: hypothetical protein E7208_00750 [Clostridium butyricum]|nr:hypothetical protein [Clostridium butyricum]